MNGWVLDVGADYGQNRIVLWLKQENGAVEAVECPFFPSLYVHAAPANLQELEETFEGEPFINALAYEEKRLWPGEPAQEVLRITLAEYRMLMKLAREIDEMGDYALYELFNVDLSIPTAFMLEKGIVPMAQIALTGEYEFEVLEDLTAIDYPLPELRSISLECKVTATSPQMAACCPLSGLLLDRQPVAGHTERDVLSGLIDAITAADPDIVYTTNGDAFLIPYLMNRARLNELDDFYLGRGRDLSPVGQPKSYFSYGRVIYRPPKCRFNGRIHIDQSSSFLFREGGLPGLIELARLSRIPLQSLSRVTPGTVITAMQIAEASQENVLIRWKKNVPEAFKDAQTLFLADRGGMIYGPHVGIHENVVEIDFTSLYPTIMVKQNISPETVLCSCCPESSHRVPVIDYPICEQRVGLIPRVLEPVIERRSEYKRRVKSNRWRDSHAIYKARKNVLKWILVTCFGYTGYKNARFGRIECHEAINAYGRELLLQTAQIAEERGYEVLHGIIDSLWLKGGARNARDHERLRQAIEHETGMPLELEGVYRWVVFLPRKGGVIGALNRYYGLFVDGTVKVRGLELRRSDTPLLIRNAQLDMLKVMARADTVAALYELMPDVIEVLRGYADRIVNNECALDELVFTPVVSRELEFYSHLTNNAACLFQLKRRGRSVHPGEQIQYIVTDAGSGRYAKKVKAWELVKGTEQYDKKCYVRYVLRAGESILSPFGYTERKLAELIKPTRQVMLPV
ncbi:MAG: DNA polymerase domain-containing protein [Candidatus Methanospirareceae archaeon]